MNLKEPKSSFALSNVERETLYAQFMTSRQSQRPGAMDLLQAEVEKATQRKFWNRLVTMGVVDSTYHRCTRRGLEHSPRCPNCKVAKELKPKFNVKVIPLKIKELDGKDGKDD